MLVYMYVDETQEKAALQDKALVSGLRRENNPICLNKGKPPQPGIRREQKKDPCQSLIYVLPIDIQVLIGRGRVGNPAASESQKGFYSSFAPEVPNGSNCPPVLVFLFIRVSMVTKVTAVEAPPPRRKCNFQLLRVREDSFWSLSQRIIVVQDSIWHLYYRWPLRVLSKRRPLAASE
ncbi:hypothetical protein HNY73_001430 [Argiope bruennichi]|uniref:Uncharacterized protein n=1 Tax=Argiope bruennichi TaxID=94029 RepID=A0A8T0G192_ARGBR|nr:hypothetical protein HNY73_001430 [Argiope bruennichi]